MPFFYDESEIEMPDDGSDPPAPRADQFVYLPPPEYGGVSDPVHFSLDVLPEPPPSEKVSFPRPSLWDRLRGRRPAPEQMRQAWAALNVEQMAKAAFVRQRLLATSVPALRELGVRQLYGRYDGGGDEGFSWLDHAVLADGADLDAAALVQQLAEQKFLDRLVAHGVKERHKSSSDRHQIASFVDNWLCMEFAMMLLGGSYGAGEYVMYGAFTVDLDACTVTDDRAADPVSRNIEIAR